MNPKSDDDRASGRTTRCILRGLIALSEGRPVMIVASTAQHAGHMGRQLLRAAAQFNIPVGEHWSPTGPPNVVARGYLEPRTGFRGVTLIDHHAIETMEAQAGI